MKIAIDWDGVIAQNRGIPTIKIMPSLMPGAKETIEILLKLGHEVYVLTNRADTQKEMVEKWLKKYSFPKLRVTNIKERGTTVYIDDRAIRFTSWQDIRKYWI